MTKKNTLVKIFMMVLLIPDFITVHCDGRLDYLLSLEKWSDMGYYADVIRTRAIKHTLCFPSYNYDCDGLLIKKPNTNLYKWFYNPFFKACTPLYKPIDKKYRCDDDDYRPNTKKGCEDLCGEPCTVIHNNNLTEPGICMMDCHIPLTAKNSQDCPYTAKCCPRVYQYPTTTPVPVTKQPVH